MYLSGDLPIFFVSHNPQVCEANALMTAQLLVEDVTAGTESRVIRGMVARRLRAPLGKWKQQNIPLYTKEEYDALRPGWAMFWRDFWFELTKKNWRSADRRGSATFRVL